MVAGADRGDAARQCRPARRFSITARAPRGLNEPVRWNSSSLRLTRVPGASRAPISALSQSITGVRTSRPASCDAVARISARVGASIATIRVAPSLLHRAALTLTPFLRTLQPTSAREACRTMRAYLADFGSPAARLGRERPDRGRAVGRHHGDRHRCRGARRRAHSRHRAAGHDRSAQPCLPARAGRADPAARRRCRQLLELARYDVRLRAEDHARGRAGDRGAALCRAAQGRLHLGGRVPLPASPARRQRPTPSARPCRWRCTRRRWKPASR